MPLRHDRPPDWRPSVGAGLVDVGQGGGVDGTVGWLAQGEHQLPDGVGWLAPREAERRAGMRYTKRRSEYALRRWAAKTAVASVLGWEVGSPDELARIEAANRVTGAPYAVVDGRPLDTGISLTDRAGWAVCVVAPDDRAVGCDLELVEPRSPGFVSDFLTAAEQDWVRSRPDSAARDAAANLLWSAKESALKVLGVGLRRDTRTVQVSVAGPVPGEDWAGLEVDTGDAVLPGWWRREGVFLLTVCSDRALAQPVRLAGSADLATARPVHSWMASPVADG